MSRGLLIVERIVIESLSKREKTFNEIKEDTGLDGVLLRSVLRCLTEMEIVGFASDYYFIDFKAASGALSEINNKEFVKEEVGELFVNLVNEHFSEDTSVPTVKLQKIFLTKNEKKEVEQLFLNIESYFQTIRASRKRNPLKESTGDQEVVVWGVSKYSNLVQNSIAS